MIGFIEGHTALGMVVSLQDSRVGLLSALMTGRRRFSSFAYRPLAYPAHVFEPGHSSNVVNVVILLRHKLELSHQQALPQ